jgi:hypothetical protein
MKKNSKKDLLARRKRAWGAKIAVDVAEKRLAKKVR